MPSYAPFYDPKARAFHRWNTKDLTNAYVLVVPLSFTSSDIYVVYLTAPTS